MLHTKKNGIRAYLFVAENTFHVLECNAFASNQAMLDADRDFPPNKNFSSDGRFFEDIVRFDHYSMDRVFLRD